MVLPKNYLTVSQQLEEAYEIVRYQNQKLNILKDVVADFMDGLNVTALFAEYGDDKESLEHINPKWIPNDIFSFRVLERASCQLTKRGDIWKPWLPTDPGAETLLPPTVPVAEAEVPSSVLGAQPNLPPTVPAAVQPKQKRGRGRPPGPSRTHLFKKRRTSHRLAQLIDEPPPPISAVAQTNLPLTTQPKRKRGRPLGPKTDKLATDKSIGKRTHQKSRTLPMRVIKIRKPPTVTVHQWRVMGNSERRYWLDAYLSDKAKLKA
ncbi:hypothetical protein LTR10_005151 [Elasticomyces elasticus]|nr:hypothetical protein LTR10_005151 [Elasticomyces elasticus]KAK4975891.1 hypothetical protein LTR42_003512 [Elasticomyces elasticus]